MEKCRGCNKANVTLIANRCIDCNKTWKHKKSKEYYFKEFEIVAHKPGPLFNIVEYPNYFRIELRIQKKKEWHMCEFEVREK